MLHRTRCRMIRVRRLDKPKIGEKLNDLNLENSNLTAGRLKTSLRIRNPKPWQLLNGMRRTMTRNPG